MSRPVYFLILVVVGLIFSAAMILTPEGFARFSGLAGGGEVALVFRALGVMILALTLCNFLVRSAADSPALAAILWMNLAVHVLTPAVDLLGVVQGVLQFGNAAPGFVVHLALAYGAYVYASRIGRT
jgi:hypothetical protein